MTKKEERRGKEEKIKGEKQEISTFSFYFGTNSKQ